MANELDELTDYSNPNGRDTRVIEKQIAIKVGKGSTIFQILLWVLGIIPGLVFSIFKVQAGNYLRKLQQKIQHDSSQIDNYLEQRVMILKNAAKLLDKAIDLDKSTFTEIAAYRSGAYGSGTSKTYDSDRNEIASKIDSIGNAINIAFENYPDLKSHQELADVMQQNSYLQREITAAREVLNDTINTWNRDVNAWPTKMIVAAKNGYTTRIPFSTSAEIKQQARDTFF